MHPDLQLNLQPRLVACLRIKVLLCRMKPNQLSHTGQALEDFKKYLFLFWLRLGEGPLPHLLPDLLVFKKLVISIYCIKKYLCSKSVESFPTFVEPTPNLRTELHAFKLGYWRRKGLEREKCQGIQAHGASGVYPFPYPSASALRVLLTISEQIKKIFLFLALIHLFWL